MNIKKLLAKVRKALFPNAVQPRGEGAPASDPRGEGTPSPVAGPVNWRGQQLFAGVNYHWSGLDWNVICPRLKALGFTGVHCELMELVTTGSLRDEQAKQMRMLKSVADSCRRHGLILMVANNSNDRLNANGGMTVELMRERLEQLRNYVGTGGVLLQPMSEYDSRTDVKVRQFARDWARQYWPADQIAQYGVSASSGFREEHSDVTAMAFAGWRTLFVTDNGSQRADQLSTAAYVALAQKHIRAGNSFAVYGFHDKPDWPAWEAIAKAFRERDNTVIEPKPPVVEGDSVPVEIMSAVGFREGAKLPFIGSMQETQTLTAARSNGRVILFEPRNPFGEGAWLCGAWREGDKWYWSDMEGLHAEGAGSTSQNYANNIFPNGPKLPGRCREKDGTAHYPRKGEPLYVFLADNRLMRRTNIVFAGLQT